MTALLRSVARLFAAAASGGVPPPPEADPPRAGDGGPPEPVWARPTASLPGRVMVALLLVGISFGLWRLAFAGFIDGGFPLSKSGQAPRLLVSEFGLTQDTLWSLSAEDPNRRQVVATVAHAPGYGIYAALSDESPLVAYTVLAPGLQNPSADSPAELWLLDLSTGGARVLAADADLLITPVWAPDGRSVVFRRSYPPPEAENAAGTFELVSVALEGGETVLAEADVALFPVGFAADGALLYTRLSPDGTDLARALPGRTTSVETLAHLSDDFTRDWRLSPKGQNLAYLAPQWSAGGIVLRAMVADLSGGANESSVRIQAAGYEPTQEFGPVWHPDGDLTLGRLSPGQSQAAAVRVEANGPEPLSKPESGFDVPIAWSPDGRLLAVRTFEGSSPLEPGRARLELVEEAGGRRPVEMQGEITVVGWLSDD